MPNNTSSTTGKIGLIKTDGALGYHKATRMDTNRSIRIEMIGLNLVLIGRLLIVQTRWKIEDATLS